MSEETNGFDLLSLMPDEDMSEQGVWIDFFDGSRLKIAQHQNQKHQNFLNNQYKTHKRQLELENKASDDMAEKISTEAAARFLLVDWDGITIDGEDKAYTYKLGIEVMNKVPTLKREVEDQSRRLQNFQKAEEEESTENLKSTSPGNSNGEAQSD